MIALFPSQPFDAKSVDSSFEAELLAAQAAGFATGLIDGETLEVRRLPADPQTTLYRGWMLTAATYAALHDALCRRGYPLINDPEQYRHTHHLPESYPIIQHHTPKTVWTSSGSAFDQAAIMRLLAPFGDTPLIVKDWVKSQKHAWDEACFIPSAQDADAVRRVVTRFIELQGESLTGGLVFREFVALEPLATHSKSGMPLTTEFRVFFLDGKPLVTAEYWEEGDYRDPPPSGLFLDVAAQVRSRFFTMDIARRTDGEWIIMELGDGQVAGLPDRLPSSRFYDAIAASALPPATHRS
jgi:hypothetical protein